MTTRSASIIKHEITVVANRPNIINYTLGGSNTKVGLNVKL